MCNSHKLQNRKERTRKKKQKSSKKQTKFILQPLEVNRLTTHWDLITSSLGKNRFEKQTIRHINFGKVRVTGINNWCGAWQNEVYRASAGLNLLEELHENRAQKFTGYQKAQSINFLGRRAGSILCPSHKPSFCIQASPILPEEQIQCLSPKDQSFLSGAVLCDFTNRL